MKGGVQPLKLSDGPQKSFVCFGTYRRWNMARNPTQKARRLRLEAALEAQKAEWVKAKAKAAQKTGAARKLAQAEAYEEEAKYLKIRRRIKKPRAEKSMLDSLVDSFI